MSAQTIGGFQVIRELGRGGMGIVYEAEQAMPRRHVALKVLPPEFAHSPGVAARFEQEANRMAQLDGHPNIATVYAAGEDNGTAYFAMQLLTGGDLEQRLARQGRFDQREAAQIIAKVADALDHAHRQGIVHRDVKPANIMFNAQGEPVVTDFGIAQAVDQVRMTMTGMSVCTPEYASPEQVKGNPVDGRSDLYSLGVVLYRMVTGRPLFDCGNPMTWAMKHMTEAPQPPEAWYPGVNPQLRNAILKCLQKEPSDRFANGHGLAQALREISWSAPGPTVIVDSPKPPLPPPATPKWPYLVGSLGFVALLVGVILVVGHPKATMPAQTSSQPAPAATTGTQPMMPASQPPPAPPQPITPPPQPEVQISAGEIAPSPPPPELPVEGIKSAITTWENEEMSGTASSYLDCYARNAQIYSNKRWYTWSQYLANERGKVGQGARVGHGDVRLKWKNEPGGPVRATFERWYQRGGVRRTGEQTLDFENIGGQWLIVKDEFHRY
ncbi:serine/threonine protein kinase [bacterium]|nr:serine/threonine protein kinase [bacterium]